MKPLKITVSDDEEEKMENPLVENNENEIKVSTVDLNNGVNNETEDRPERKEEIIEQKEKKEEEKKEIDETDAKLEEKKEDAEKIFVSKNNIRYKYIETFYLKNVNVPDLDKDYYTLFEPELNSENCNDEKNPGGNITLEKCIDLFFEYEKMNIKNNYFACENCSKENNKEQKS